MSGVDAFWSAGAYTFVGSDEHASHPHELIIRLAEAHEHETAKAAADAFGSLEIAALGQVQQSEIDAWAESAARTLSSRWLDTVEHDDVCPVEREDAITTLAGACVRAFTASVCALGQPTQGRVVAVRTFDHAAILEALREWEADG